jgi:hypothetical protein
VIGDAREVEIDEATDEELARAIGTLHHCIFPTPAIRADVARCGGLPRTLSEPPVPYRRAMCLSYKRG